MLAFVMFTFVARPAAANGAFPDSQAVLTPAGRPNQIVLATNFGIIRSEDGGGTWLWSCEQDQDGTRNLYQFGPPPAHRLYARDQSGLVHTDDGGCTWHAAGGALLDGFVISDAFPDPTRPERVLAVAAPRGGTQGNYRVIESADGGATFTAVRYSAPPGDTINGVEISRADPGVVYLVILGGASFAPRLARTNDGGAAWIEQDLSAQLGDGAVSLVAIDPQDPGRVFLQANGGTTARLVIADGGGAIVRIPLVLEGGFMTGFVRTPGGTILVSGLTGGDAVLERSTDGGASFQPVPHPPRLWGLSERAGTVFGAARTGEPFAVGTSSDEGTTWQPLMRYTDVQAIDACLGEQCRDICLAKASAQIWSAAICSPAPAPDGGADARPRGAGCGYALAPAPGPLTLGLLAGALLLLPRRRRRRPAAARAPWRPGARGGPPRGDP